MPSPASPEESRRMLDGSGTVWLGPSFENWFTTLDMLATESAPAVTPKSFVMNKCVVGVISISVERLPPGGFVTENWLQSVLNESVQYVSTKLAAPPVPGSPLKRMDRSLIVVPLRPLTSK